METNGTPMRIVRLEAENVKRLTAVEITPEGSLVVVGGRNGQGKSSVLDSIAMALGGKDLVPELPLRKGEKHGHVSVDLGDLVVRRTFTEAGGGTLTVANREGQVYRSPQAILDRLVGTLSFDPLEFARMDPKAQRETLRALVGLDFTELEAEREALFAERTAVNRQAKTLRARLEAMPAFDEVPAPVSVTALLAELEAAQESQMALELEVDRHDDAMRQVENASLNMERIDEQIRRLQEQRAAFSETLAEAAAAVERLGASVDALKVAKMDDAPIREKIAAAEGINAIARAYEDAQALALEVGAQESLADEITGKIEALEDRKAAALAGAAFPVPGLSFDEHRVLLNGLPFSQASSAEQLRVSVAMGLAANPRLRVLLIRDGSLLDEESLALVAKMAAEAEAQVWMERVGEGAECSVVIEDGAVRASAEAAV